MRVLITGGAGFIGCNVAKRFLDKKAAVVILDNLSRKGTDKNLNWLKACANNKNLTFIRGDVCNNQLMDLLFRKSGVGEIDLVFHMAAQVAVTTSVANPREDFEINTVGTFNLLEAIRNSKQKPIIINASTNKVYGKMELAKVVKKRTRYEYKNLRLGISEKIPLDFYSPYGCSKGAADQYVLDYSRIYGLNTINFRQSCIYGPRQFGIEDQGWVAHFIISAIFGKPITIYGDGKQVRDILFIDDLMDAFLLAVENIEISCGKVYNIGGGCSNSISLLEFVDLLEKQLSKKIQLKFSDWRPGDQKIYISDTRRAQKDFGWKPKIDVKKGIGLLIEWVKENRKLFDDF
ncbi:MAG: SDR family NAD(P)-dependent oxidoreductase [Candidatus Omnitrophica bacterium]|nr:SDR family NAD(P)-dependent oxidoreductase [Candidatus Omnitrophota bacterium]